MENKKKSIFTNYIIGSAIIWAATILGCALILKERFDQVSLLLTGGAAIHSIIWSALATQLKKQREQGKLKQE